MKDLSDKIKLLRVETGLSQKELGNVLGISDRAVFKWENGISKPSLDNIFKLSSFFRVSPEYFNINNSKVTGKTVLNDSDSYVEPDFDSIGIKKDMESLTELYKIGRGPSSSHTIGPEKAAMEFKVKNPEADLFVVVLYGSLAKTGKGHCTESVIKKTFSPVKCEVKFDYHDQNIPHPNTMDILAYKNNVELSNVRVFSIGGGSILTEGEEDKRRSKIYEHNTFSDIALYCKKNELKLWEYVFERENEAESFLHGIWDAMKASIKNGLEDEGVLPGGLNVCKKAKILYNSQHIDESSEIRENRLVCSYAYAVGEQNASGERIVTAPTCGAAGVLPAVLYYYQKKNGFSDTKIIQALATAGLVGNLIKTNASISGAECGCQAEIGTACAMAAAGLGELFDLSIEKIEYAAEIAVEHHLGLTCDPVCGLVQIPCIERNAVAAMRAINSVNLASFLWNTRKISLDNVILTMKNTGRDMNPSYKETSEAGLSKIDVK